MAAPGQNHEIDGRFEQVWRRRHFMISTKSIRPIDVEKFSDVSVASDLRAAFGARPKK
jgi:hypothetical protein